MRASRLYGVKKHTATEALVGIYAVILSVSVVVALYFGREILMPLALAALLTFMLAPLVSRIERIIGRVAAVTIVAALVFCLMGTITWVLTRQALDLANRLPGYRANIDRKIHALELSKEGPIKRFSKMVSEIESEIPSFGAVSSTSTQAVPSAGQPTVETPTVKPLTWVISFAGVLATCGIVSVLVIFMLLQREDIRGRMIKIVGQGRISSTSRAMEDAAGRVARYLTTQLMVNVAFGTTFAVGLYFIGLPNAFLWGALTAVLRFIPYIGAWLAALCPILLSIAVSPGWQVLALTLGLFLLLELVTGNFVEPLLYRSSTGVSSLALIVAAIFWTWLWGPMGLLLSTPLTVCLAVLGRHVPRLSFFRVLLGNEEALTPAEECYQRLLVGSLGDASRVVDDFLHAHSLTATYDSVLVPAITLAEMDFERENLDETQRRRVLQGARDMIDDVSSRVHHRSKVEADRFMAENSTHPPTMTDYRVVCISTRGERDDLAGAMLAHLLQEHGVETLNVAATAADLLVRHVGDFKADAVCLSVIPPTTVVHARHLCARLRSGFPELKIVVGIWGATENLDEAVRTLQSSGADNVVVSMAEAVIRMAALSAQIGESAVPAPRPKNEADRLTAVRTLELFESTHHPELDDIAKKVARTFDVAVSLVTLIDHDRQLLKSKYGLQDELAGVCEMERDRSVCTHVVGCNAPLVVEDLARDRRFARNPGFQHYGLRFYAGVPLHADNGQPVGALCVLDTKPRKFAESEMRLLKLFGEEISAGLTSTAAAPSAAA